MPSLRLAKTKKLFEGRRALAVAIVACIVFLLLGVLVRYSFLRTFDLDVTRELQKGNWPPLVALMVALTYTGSPAVVPVVGVLAAFGLYRAVLPRAAGLALLSLLAIPIDTVLKTFWDRARPDAEIVHVAVKTAGTSFPSGHAMGSTAFYGALAALAWIHIEDRRTRFVAVGLLCALIVGICASRVYLGAHWLSDVVGGGAVGLLVLIPLLRWYLRGIPDEVETQAQESSR